MDSYINDYTEEPYEDLAEVIGDAEVSSDDFAEERDTDDSGEDIIDEEWLPRRNRKPLVGDRIVNSLEICLDKDDYDEYILPHQPIEFKCILRKPKIKFDAGQSIT